MNRTGRFLRALGIGLLIATTVPACVLRAQGSARFSSGALVVYEEPPPPQPMVRAGYVYVDGQWANQGGRWQWVGGHWERERASARWQPGHWEARGNQWHWVAGMWINGGAVVTGGGNAGPVMDRNGGAVDHRVPPPQQAPAYPTAPPPPVQVENPGMRGGYIWVTGYYQWQNGGYQWVPGHWERERANMIWVAGRWELRGNQYFWVEGSWQAAPRNPRDHRH